MEPPSCRGCIRARDDDGYPVPGSPACLGCGRAVPGSPDLWAPGPPGGTPATCDERGVSFRSPLPHWLRCAGLAAAGLLAGLAFTSEGLTALLLVAAAAGMCAVASHLSSRGVRHTLGVWGERVWHVAGVGRIALRRAYPADAIRVFHCAGPRVNGPVSFHHGRYTVRLTTLSPGADNEWLVRQLNDRLKLSRE